MYLTICKIDSYWEVSLEYRELSLVLCDNLEGWEVQEGVDTCILMADSSCCMPEANTML